MVINGVNNYVVIHLNSLLSRFNIGEIKKISRLIIFWCFDHWGDNNRIKKPLRIHLDYDKESDYYAEYIIEKKEHILRILLNKNKTIEDLISSILHEFTHRLQSDKEYDRLSKKYSYSKHPHEKMAIKISEHFSRVCWNDLESRIKKELTR